MTVYTPEKSKQAERRINDQWTSNGGPFFPKNVTVDVRIFVTPDGTSVEVTPVEERQDSRPGLRGDVDNYAKTILDGLNGAAWEDDSQVVHLEVTKA